MNKAEEIKKYVAERFKAKDYKCFVYRVNGFLVAEICCYTPRPILTGKTLAFFGKRFKYTEIKRIVPADGDAYTALIFHETCATIISER